MKSKRKLGLALLIALAVAFGSSAFVSSGSSETASAHNVNQANWGGGGNPDW